MPGQHESMREIAVNSNADDTNDGKGQEKKEGLPEVGLLNPPVCQHRRIALVFEKDIGYPEQTDQDDVYCPQVEPVDKNKFQNGRGDDSEYFKPFYVVGIQGCSFK